ncbi:MAG: hypothetical protein ABEN55_13470 [Bradymonadaceae bacterium]
MTDDISTDEEGQPTPFGMWRCHGCDALYSDDYESNIDDFCTYCAASLEAKHGQKEQHQ